jgi:hypothetical protein
VSPLRVERYIQDFVSFSQALCGNGFQLFPEHAVVIQFFRARRHISCCRHWLALVTQSRVLPVRGLALSINTCKETVRVDWHHASPSQRRLRRRDKCVVPASNGEAGSLLLRRSSEADSGDCRWTLRGSRRLTSPTGS